MRQVADQIALVKSADPKIWGFRDTLPELMFVAPLASIRAYGSRVCQH